MNRGFGLYTGIFPHVSGQYVHIAVKLGNLGATSAALAGRIRAMIPTSHSALLMSGRDGSVKWQTSRYRWPNPCSFVGHLPLAQLCSRPSALCELREAAVTLNTLRARCSRL